MSDPLKKLDKAATLLDAAYARGVAEEQSDAVALDMYLEANPATWPSKGVAVDIPNGPGWAESRYVSLGVVRLSSGIPWLEIEWWPESARRSFIILRPLSDVAERA
jgi:hypothetical protein